MMRKGIALSLLLSLALTMTGVKSEYKEPLSLLQMGPEIYKAAEEYLAHKEKQIRLKQRKRSLQAVDDDQTDDVVADDVEVADEEEEIIDPSEMPDSWEDGQDAEFVDPIKDESSECVRTLMDLTNNFMTYNNTVMHIFRNSGKDYNDFGRYEDCSDIQHFNYFMVTVLKKFPIPITLGLCLP